MVSIFSILQNIVPFISVIGSCFYLDNSTANLRNPNHEYEVQSIPELALHCPTPTLKKDTIYVSKSLPVLKSIEDLRKFDHKKAQSVVVAEPLRGCGHIFKYSPVSKLPVDNGVVFASESGGIWIRQYSEINKVNLLWFMNTSKPKNNPNFDSGQAIEVASKYLESVSTRGGTISIPAGLYFTTGFKLKPRINLEGAGIKGTYFQMMKGSNKVAMVDLTNCYELFITRVTFFGDLQGKSIHGIFISTNDRATNSVENLRVFDCVIQKFSGNGIHSPKSNKTYSFKIYDNRIQENAGWGIFNGATDNEFSFNYVFSNKKGGIQNIGSNNRFYGGKILLNGSSNPESGGIHDSSSRSIYANIECQENYYHGIILENSHNVTMQGMLSDMNNTSMRPTFELGGKGETNSVGYGLLMKGTCSQNNIELQLTSSTLVLTKQTQFSYKIDNAVREINYLTLIESNQYKKGINLAGDNIKMLHNHKPASYVYTYTADGSKTIRIPHSLGTTPTDYFIKPENSNAANIEYTEPTAKDILVHYITAPKGQLKFRVSLSK